MPSKTGKFSSKLVSFTDSRKSSPLVMLSLAFIGHYLLPR